MQFANEVLLGAAKEAFISDWARPLRRILKKIVPEGERKEKG